MTVVCHYSNVASASHSVQLLSKTIHFIYHLIAEEYNVGDLVGYFLTKKLWGSIDNFCVCVAQSAISLSLSLSLRV